MIAMNTQRTPLTDFINPFEAAALLRRMVSNLRGFAYRRRDDWPWTMEWVSDAFRSITGYDPHRFTHNPSLSFAGLILPEDRPGVLAQINNALASRHRTAVTYRIMAAHQTAVTVEDRLVGIYDASGNIVAVEGIIDYAPAISHPASLPSYDAPWSADREFSQPFILKP